MQYTPCICYIIQLGYNMLSMIFTCTLTNEASQARAENKYIMHSGHSQWAVAYLGEFRGFRPNPPFRPVADPEGAPFGWT